MSFVRQCASYCCLLYYTRILDIKSYLIILLRTFICMYVFMNVYMYDFLLFFERKTLCGNWYIICPRYERTVTFRNHGTFNNPEWCFTADPPLGGGPCLVVGYINRLTLFFTCQKALAVMELKSSQVCVAQLWNTDVISYWLPENFSTL